MAQILSFPRKATAEVVEAIAEFDRMLAHHADLQQRTLDFVRLCALADPDEPEAEFHVCADVLDERRSA